MSDSQTPVPIFLLKGMRRGVERGSGHVDFPSIAPSDRTCEIGRRWTSGAVRRVRQIASRRRMWRQDVSKTNCSTGQRVGRGEHLLDRAHRLLGLGLISKSQSSVRIVPLIVRWMIFGQMIRTKPG